MTDAIFGFILGLGFGIMGVLIFSHAAAGYIHGHAHASAYWKKVVEFTTNAKLRAEAQLEAANKRISELEYRQK